MSNPRWDIVIVGGGASGLLCAIYAGRKGRRVLVLEQGPKCGLKILVSGGGRCNFTNIWTDARAHFLSANEHFCISALSRYTPWDFIALIEDNKIAYHEKKLGQQFCSHSAKDLLHMLLQQAQAAGVEIKTRTQVRSIDAAATGGFAVASGEQHYHADKVVVASGGLSMPKISSDLAFRTARQFGLEVVETSPALVPFTWNNADRERFAQLSGVSLPALVSCGDSSFAEDILFTHRGLSGPGILQISSYWKPGEAIAINLLPGLDVFEWFVSAQESSPRILLSSLLQRRLPKRLVQQLIGAWFEDCRISEVAHRDLRELANKLHQWVVKPGGTEGYRTAEVTLGGVATDAVSSKTFEVKQAPGLYIIGEALDVTGWLGGFNFQWAWSSAYCCAEYL
ncbi:MAG: aminoacetone oxidase family FAD-binding enzyme [Gammaproteobacteria bacterium]|nr:aminoacetone oxidase family FAD-binding enzyme [Gammaproteobacteria bacterium]